MKIVIYIQQKFQEYYVSLLEMRNVKLKILIIIIILGLSLDVQYEADRVGSGRGKIGPLSPLVENCNSAAL